MRQAKDFLPFIECALEVFASQTEEPKEALPPNTERGVVFDYRPIDKFLGRGMTEVEYYRVGEILCEALDTTPECGVWTLAHILQHMTDSKHKVCH